MTKYTGICTWPTYYCKQRENISSRFSGNSEASASELPENLEDMFPCSYIDSDVISRFQSLITHVCVTRRERAN